MVTQSCASVSWVHGPHVMLHPCPMLFDTETVTAQEIAQAEQALNGGTVQMWLQHVFLTRLIPLLGRWVEPSVVGF